MLRRRLRLVFLGLGILLLGYTGSGLVRNRTWLVDAVDADGVVVDLPRTSDGAASPVIRFTTETGAVVDWVSRASTAGGTYSVGEHVPVLYIPDRPGSTTIGSIRNILGLFLLTGVAGLVLTLMGARTAQPFWRRNRSAR